MSMSAVLRSASRRRNSELCAISQIRRGSAPGPGGAANPYLRQCGFGHSTELDSMSRLTIDMTNQKQQSAKALAAMQGKTIKQYTLERLFPGDADADRA